MFLGPQDISLISSLPNSKEGAPSRHSSLRDQWQVTGQQGFQAWVTPSVAPGGEALKNPPPHRVWRGPTALHYYLSSYPGGAFTLFNPRWVLVD